jgi:hypothetical protein
VTDRKKMEGSCSTGQSPQRAAVPVEEEEDPVTSIVGPHGVLISDL